MTNAIEVAVDEESRWGGTDGVFVTLRLNDLVAFQPEALYVVKGETLVSRAEPDRTWDSGLAPRRVKWSGA